LVVVGTAVEGVREEGGCVDDAVAALSEGEEAVVTIWLGESEGVLFYFFGWIGDVLPDGEVVDAVSRSPVTSEVLLVYALRIVSHVANIYIGSYLTAYMIWTDELTVKNK
jgi:hypothetical protein